MMERERFIALAQRYLDGELDETEARELHGAIVASEELREQLRAQAAVHAVMGQRFGRRNGSVGRRVQAALRDPSQKKGAITRIMDKLAAKRPQKKEPLLIPLPIPERNFARTFLLVAASLAVALLSVALLSRLYTHPGAIESAKSAWAVPADASAVALARSESGSPSVTRNGKDLALAGEQRMVAGDIISTSSADAATLQYPDGTIVKIAAGSKLALQPQILKSEAGIGIDLAYGAIEAVVAHQAPEKPMIVVTPQGRATIVGTRFKLSADAAQSRLEVIEGKVRLTSALKAESVLVENGHSAVLSPDMALDTVATRRDPALWPFSAQSPWNFPLGSAAQFAPVDSPRFDAAKGAELIVYEYAIPIAIATPADPMRVFYRHAKANGKQLRIPLDAKPDPSQFNFLNLVDEKHFKVYELIGAEVEADGAIHLRENSYYNSLQHMGVYADNKQHGTRIYGGSSMGGIVRTGELQGGIRHALGIGVVMKALNANAPGGRPYVWPACNALMAWETMYGRSGNLHLGSLLAIPPDIDIQKIGVGNSGPAYEIARALQDYGAYIIEHSEDSIHDAKFYFEPTTHTEMFRGLGNQLGIVMKYLKVVTNNSPENVGGGGKPRRALAPPFAEEFLQKTDTAGQF